MKKVIALIVVCVCLSSALSAQTIEMSAGGGGFFGMTFYSGDLNLEPRMGFGAFGFFDATFVEADIGVCFTNQNDVFVTNLMLGLFGKYPVYMAGFTLFPMAGVQFNFPLAITANGSKEEFGDKYARKDYTDFWIKAGAGADIDVTRRIYIRPSLLYGINLTKPNDAFKLTHGFEIRVAAGYWL